MDPRTEQPTHDVPLDRADTQLGTQGERAIPREPTLTQGDRLGHYQVLRKLGVGAMGTVVEAYDETLDRRVAIKLLHERQGNRQERRLLREAQALARLSHSNVVQVYEVGEAQGHLFIAMELVVGQTLDRWQSQPRAWREIVDAYAQAGRGLAAAHAEDLIHRDFKPSNCIIDERGQVKVLDFGLARDSTDEAAATVSNARQAGLLDLASMEGSQSNRALSEALTRTGALLGTPAYMAPEQLMGRGAGPLSDQFNFCVAFYEALYGRRPFPYRSIGELVSAVFDGKPTPPGARAPGPRALWPVLRRGLSRNPKDRWPTMEALLLRLAQVSHRRSRRRWLAVTGLAAATTGGVLWGQTNATPCRGAQAHMDGVWDAARSQAVGDALLATGVPYADATRQRVLAGLDEYAARWVDHHTAACEATRVHGEQSTDMLDLRMRCLAQARTSIVRTAELLEASDSAMVENAVPMVSSLPSLSRCDDVVALTNTLPLSDDPTQAAETEALRDRLAHTRALGKADHITEALAVVEGVVPRAEALGHGPLLADALMARGYVLQQLGRYPEAESDLIAAYELALELGHDETAARTSHALTNIAGNLLARPQVGRTWGRTAEALARRLDPEGPLHAMALRTTAIVQFSRDQIDEAAERFAHALRIWEAQPGPAGLDRASALSDMGNLRARQGRLDEAVALYGRANTIWLDRFGDGHPALAVGAINLGRIYEMQGELVDAEAEHRRALALWESARGPDHPDVAAALNNLAVVHDKQGQPDAALELYERVLTIRRGALGPSHPLVAQTLSNVGLAWRAKDELGRALSYFQDAVEIFEEHGGRDLERSLYQLGETERRLGRLEDARAHLERLRSLAAAHEDEESHRLAVAEFALAQVQWAQDRRDEARALVLESLKRVDAAGPPGEALRGEMEAWMAERSMDR